MSGRLIIVDWGTSSFRAWLVDAASGAVLAEIGDGLGMRALSRNGFAAYCHERLGPWRDGATPVYMAGMVGAPQGWQQAPQPPLPATPESLARDVVAVADMAGVFIIPGVRVASADPAKADVMRGEEVQIFGALSLVDWDYAVLCLPGTHSKWADVEGGVLTRFSTSMTGEVHEVMLAHSVLGLAADRDAPFAEVAFDAGLSQSVRRGGLLNHLFSARARGIHGDLRAEDVASYLSGLLIGSEIAAMTPLYASGAGEILLVSNDRLAVPYGAAFSRAGLAYRHVTAREATLAGVTAIARLHAPELFSEAVS
ncbi:2-dehydro-3-deoxygalactonokinase [Rhodobium gokarnense]|uniref:2-dehydro-3-deoxygalactonokinase n=1 Tax=Rhodobium gokarnense TaxID=364296 RepID=A0ABT3H6L5_9HYPH|nr:2-dehydro-3-deoxygalactonokinase [Rhodobium gokarnense]MCW2305984.1 2-dehydro-3-deoxygalactonokinase [Rhodobium gokarnense]